MPISITAEELVEFHNESFVPENGAMTKFLLGNPDLLLGKLTILNTPKTDAGNLQLGDLILDEENLIQNDETEEAKEFIEFQKQHRAQFLQEIKDKNLSLKGTSNDEPMIEVIEPCKKRKHQPLNY